MVATQTKVFLETTDKRNPEMRVPWRQVLQFTMLAYALSWLWWAPLVVPNLDRVSLLGRLPDLAENHAAGRLAIGMFGPLIAAVIMRLVVSRERLKGSVGVLRPQRYYFIAFAAPALFIAVLIGINHLTGLGRFVWTRPVPIWAAYPLTVLLNTVLGIPLTFGEEYGWRGYLLPRLLPLGEMRATLLLGTIWGLWHLPALLIGLNYPGQPLWAALLVFAVNILLLAFPFSWLFIASRGSPLVVAVMHASLNAAGDGFTSPTHIPQGNPLIVGAGGLTTAVLMLGIVVIWYAAFKRQERAMARSLKPELQGNLGRWR